MKIYVGYMGGDYAHALFLGTNKEKIEEQLAKVKGPYKWQPPKWIEEYELKEGKVIELNCD